MTIYWKHPIYFIIIIRIILFLFLLFTFYFFVPFPGRIDTRLTKYRLAWDSAQIVLVGVPGSAQHPVFRRRFGSLPQSSFGSYDYSSRSISSQNAIPDQIHQIRFALLSASFVPLSILLSIAK